MSERRISGWFVLSAVFIIAVFGLFFTFTERKTWPEQRIELSAMDMRLVPPSSTLWCEAVALYSEHPFIAYQVNQGPLINGKRLDSQKVHLQLTLGSNWNSNSRKLKYFLLPKSVVEIFACASNPGGRLLVFKGATQVAACLQTIFLEEKGRIFDDSDEMSSEESEVNEEEEYEEDLTESPPADNIPFRIRSWGKKRCCSSLIADHSLEIGYSSGEGSNFACAPSTDLRPLKINISSADDYVIAILNTNHLSTNHVTMNIMLDRSRYNVHKSGQAFDMCSLSTSCTIGLGFATGDRVLVSIPDEPNAGRTSFIVRARCKPRLAVFAILSVFLPLIIFLVVAFVIRADRDRIRRLYTWGERRTEGNQRRFVRPLLDDGNASSNEVLRPPPDGVTPHISSENYDELPPPYHTLYDPPPPYPCLKEGSK